MPDRDKFTSADACCRRAAQSIVSALATGDLPRRPLLQAFHSILKLSDGSGFFAALMSRLREQLPLLPEIRREELTGVPEEYACSAKDGLSVLDLVAQRAYKRLFQQDLLDQRSFARAFVDDALGHFVLEAAHGVLDEMGAEKYFRSEHEIRAFLAPIATILADLMQESPDRKRLPRELVPKEVVTLETDLRGLA